MYPITAPATNRRTQVSHPKMYFLPAVTDITVNIGTPSPAASYSGLAHTTIDSNVGDTTSIGRLLSAVISCEL